MFAGPFNFILSFCASIVATDCISNDTDAKPFCLGDGVRVFTPTTDKTDVPVFGCLFTESRQTYGWKQHGRYTGRIRDSVVNESQKRSTPPNVPPVGKPTRHVWFHVSQLLDTDRNRGPERATVKTW